MATFAPEIDQTGYINLTTFKKDGTPVTTVVWVVRDGDNFLVTTADDSGKAKRARATGRAEVGPADRQGKVLGPSVPATVRQLPIDAVKTATPLFRKRYGILSTGIFTMNRWRGMKQVMLEVTPA